MPHRIAIRRATVADARIIAGHRVAMFREMGQVGPEHEETLLASTLAAVAPMLDADRYVAWLATAADRPDAVVGGAGALLRRTLPGPRAYGISDGRQALVLNVYTDPAWRRRGVAEALVRALLTWLRDREIREVVLHASDAARPLYERLGFVPTNELRLRSALSAPTAPSPSS